MQTQPEAELVAVGAVDGRVVVLNRERAVERLVTNVEQQARSMSARADRRVVVAN